LKSCAMVIQSLTFGRVVYKKNLPPMLLKRTCLTAAIFGLAVFQAGGQTAKRDRELQMLADHVFHLSEVMLHDATNPPAASRVYSYALFGARQVAAMAKGHLPQIND